MDKDAIKKMMTPEDVSRIVVELGSAYPKKDINGNLLFQTICHGGDSFKLYYYIESREFHCFTHCQESFDIYGLILKMFPKYNFVQALSYIAKKMDVKLELSNPKGFQTVFKPMEDWDLIDKYSRIYDRINSVKVEKEKKYYNEHILQLFDDVYPKNWIEEGISIESMMKYGIRFRKSENEIIIPHRDIEGRLVGIRSRTLVEEKIQQGFKYMPTYINGSFYAHETQEHIYGLDINKENIKRLSKIMLVEGEKSVLKCDTYYGEGNFTVGLSGFNLSKKQRTLILSLGVKECILAFDKPSVDEWTNPDKKNKYIKNIQRIGQMLSPYMTVNVLWDNDFLLDFKDSPVDKGSSVLEQLMKKKEEILTREE